MDIVIAAVGKLRDGPEKDLYDRYIARLPWKTGLIEIVDKTSDNREQRRQQEGEKLRRAIPQDAVVVALDEKGKHLSSTVFAGKIGKWRDNGVRNIAFVIGGADGLSEKVLSQAELKLSLGPMTWPHLLARVMLVEQLYRASTVLSGHPYHRN